MTRLHNFPNDPLLVRLLLAAKKTPDSQVIVHDHLGFRKTYPELLGDVLRMSTVLRAQLPPSSMHKNGVLLKTCRYIAIVAPGGYEYLVAFFAIRAIGGACVPLREKSTNRR